MSRMADESGVESSRIDRFASAKDLREDRENGGGSAFGSDAVQAHPMGLAQGMAERFHREGLPVARLWENHAALVSLGLNQKGKPGIWLVQKIH